MNIPNIPVAKLVDENGELNEIWHNFFFQLLQLMQQNLSDEGFVIPSQNTADTAIIATKAMNGTVIFNPETVNGGGVGSPNGQLYVRLADGVFHPITNT